MISWFHFTREYLLDYTSDIPWGHSHGMVGFINKGGWRYVYRFYDPSPWILYSNIRREIRQGDWKL